MLTILNVLGALMWISFSCIISFYALYFLILNHYIKKKEDTDPSDSFRPHVSMIVPIHNEEGVILKKIQNLVESNYPKNRLEVIFIDGCSTDNTARIISNYAKNHSFIRLIQQDGREGYNAAVFEGFSHSTGDIIAITQADALYEPNALELLVRHFADPKVGAVTGKQIISNRGEGVAPGLTGVYRDFYDFVRMAETRMDSPFDIKGEICAVRREICEHLLMKSALLARGCVDCCLSSQARLEGYKTLFEPSAKYHEYVPQSVRERMQAQVRRGTVLIESLLLFKNMLFNKKYGLFGLIILPAHLVMLTALPWMFLLGALCIPAAIISNPIITSLLLAVLLTGLAVNSKFRMLLLSFVQSQVALVIATLRVATHRESQMIPKISSTRR